MIIYESEFCVADDYAPPGRDRFWYIGDNYEGHDSPTWPSREAMISDLEAILVALRAVEESK